MDRDGDGKLTVKEMRSYLDRVQRLEAKAMASRVSLLVSGPGRGLFDLLDRDRDGRLSLRELRGAAGLLGHLGLRGTRRLSRDQLPRGYQLALGLGQASFRGGRGGVMIPPEGALAYPGVYRNRGPLWFRKMDRNGDGDVSPREFLGPPAMFRRLDADG